MSCDCPMQSCCRVFRNRENDNSVDVSGFDGSVHSLSVLVPRLVSLTLRPQPPEVTVLANTGQSHAQ